MKRFINAILVILLSFSIVFALSSCEGDLFFFLHFDSEEENTPPQDGAPSDVIPDDEPNDDPEDDPNKEDESVDDNTDPNPDDSKDDTTEDKDPNPDDSKDDTTEDKDPEDDKKEEESGNENEQEKVPNYNDGGINLPFIPAT